LTATDYHM